MTRRQISVYVQGLHNVALVEKLVKLGIPANAARHLGWTVQTGIAGAANNSQANGLKLTANINLIETANANDLNSVTLMKLDACANGIVFIVNMGLSGLNVFPAVGEKFNGLAINAKISLNPDEALLIFATQSQWVGKVIT